MLRFSRCVAKSKMILNKLVAEENLKSAEPKLSTEKERSEAKTKKERTKHMMEIQEKKKRTATRSKTIVKKVLQQNKHTTS